MKRDARRRLPDGRMAGLCHAQSEMNYELWAATAFRPLYSDNEPLSSLSPLCIAKRLDKGASFAAEVLPLVRPEEQISRGANGIIKTEHGRKALVSYLNRKWRRQIGPIPN